MPKHARILARFNNSQHAISSQPDYTLLNPGDMWRDSRIFRAQFGYDYAFALRYVFHASATRRQRFYNENGGLIHADTFKSPCIIFSRMQ